MGCKNEVRKRYNIELGKDIVFFGASNIGEKRKGIQYFIKALDLLFEDGKNKNILVCIAGNTDGLAKRLNLM